MIDWIKENAKNAFKTKLKQIKYNVGQKVLVYSGVVKSKDHQYLRKNLSKKKTVKGYAIPAIIVQLKSGYALVRILQRSKIVKDNVEKDEEYKVTFNLIKKSLVKDGKWKMKVYENKVVVNNFVVIFNFIIYIYFLRR